MDLRRVAGGRSISFRFVGDEVVRVETMKVDGQKIVRTEKEVILQRDKDKDQEAKKEPNERSSEPSKSEASRGGFDDVPKPSNGAPPPIVMPPPDFPQPPNGPGENCVSAIRRTARRTIAPEAIS